MLSQEEVKNVALLARIGITDSEVENYRRDLSAVLDFFQELQKLETKDVEPIGHITGRNDVARADETVANEEESRVAIRKNFPDSKGGYLKVKSVF